MGIVDQAKKVLGDLFYAPAGGPPGKQVEQRISSHLKNPQFVPYNFRNAIHNAYRKNEIVFSGIDYIKRSLSQSTMRVKDKDALIDGHSWQGLTTHPNNHYDENQLLEMIISHLYLAGNAYVEIVWNESRTRAVELWPLMPHRVKIAGSASNIVEGYVYEVNGKKFQLPREDVIHIRFQDPGDERIGMPPIQAAFPRIDVDNESADFVKSLLENSAIPGTIIKTSDDSFKDEEKRKRFEKRWQRKFGGSSRGKPAFLDRESEIETVGLDIEQLALPNLTNISESRILMTMGISPILVQSLVGLERSVFQNYEEARIAFWEDTVFPLQSRIASAFSEQGLRTIEENRDVKVFFDNSDVPAVQSIRRKEREHALVEWKETLISRDEYREAAGRHRHENEFGNQHRSDMGTMFFNPDDGEDPPEPNENDSEQDEKKTRTADSFTLPTGKSVKLMEDRDHRIKQFRNELADQHYGRLLEWSQREFARQQNDVEVIFNESTKQFDGEIRDKIMNEMDQMEEGWRQRMASPDADDSIFPIVSSAADGAGRSVAIELGFDPDKIDATVMAAFAREEAYKFAGTVSSTSVKKIRGVMDEAINEGLTIAQTRNNLMNEMDGWGRDRAEMVARTESQRAVHGGTEFAYQVEGVPLKRWLAAGDPCEFCAELNGTIVSVGSNFAELGDEIQGDPGTSSLNVSYSNVSYPPVHPQCRCTIVAEFEN